MEALQTSRVSIALASAATILATMAVTADATPVYQPTDDTTVTMVNPDTPSGSAGNMVVVNRYGHPSHPPTWQWDTLVRFDLTDIPPGTLITSATLYLYYFALHDNDPVGRVLTCYRITGDWAEETVTWNTQPGNASEASASAVVPAYFAWMIWDVTTDVQAFVNGVHENFGWQIKDEVPWGDINIPWTQFRTKESGVQVPFLEVNAPISVESGSWGSIKALFQ
jgi:hypothetical protein